ncbi:MAG: NAD(P)H-quinone oxidoreductase [Bacteroidetes bacterium]|nr:MAG: NAD(P)H-quinone oxidoreductase [Bacteroidota bacterium]
MKAIQYTTGQGPEGLYLGDYPDPQPTAEELLVEVHATALNRADLLQCAGKYPPPPGASPLLGLEVAGTVVGWGPAVQGFTEGERVCGLLAGGGYAERVVLPASLAMRIPQNLSFTEAAAIPEVFLTAFQALYWLAKLRPGERILIHAGASGVGTAAIQLAQFIGAKQIIVSASAPKHEFCLKLGAHATIDYQNEDFAARVAELTAGQGVDVLIDFVGGPNFVPNLEVLAMDGRLVMLAFLGGTKVEQLKLLPILRKRLHIMGSTLRNRPLAYKAQLTADFQRHCWAAFLDGRLRPVIDRVYPWEEVAEAHRYMAANKNRGKIVLKVKA